MSTPEPKETLAELYAKLNAELLHLNEQLVKMQTILALMKASRKDDSPQG